MRFLHELILPADDRLVLVEAAIAVVTMLGLGWRWRHRAERRLMVWGIGLVVFGLMALRSLH